MNPSMYMENIKVANQKLKFTLRMVGLSKLHSEMWQIESRSRAKKQKDFEHLVQTFCYDIVGKWNEFFVFGKKPKRTKITRRLL